MSYSNLKIDRTKIISSVYEKCINEGYDEYLIGSIENIDGTTRVLSSSEVDKTIMDALKLIEEYYSWQ